MLVQLDEETWEVSDAVRLDEVLADVNDRAEAQGRLVTELIVGNQQMTDRELVPLTLSKAASTFGTIVAKSQKMNNILEYSEETGHKFGQQLRSDAQQFVKECRQGRPVLQQLDQWFGKMADYLEWAHIQQSLREGGSDKTRDLSYWVGELMDARQTSDEVRMMDVLEYEVIPRLPD